MSPDPLAQALSTLWSELVDGATPGGSSFVLNSGDTGLLGSLDRLSAADASRAIEGGATIAAHAQHLRYGLTLMNRWAREGGNPFADAHWDEAWRTKEVDAAAWQEIRDGLSTEARTWLEALRRPRTTNATELAGMVASVAHLAYHLGAIRQIDKKARGPREGTFVAQP